MHPQLGKNPGIIGCPDPGSCTWIALLERMLAARNFQSAMAMVRQLEFALFDFRLHQQWADGDSDDVQALLDAVRAQVSVVPVPAFNRFQNGFSHIFAGGYSSGYYAYLWSEILDADGFTAFKDSGDIFDPELAARLKENVYQAGGSRDANELYRAFRGEDPSIEPLLEIRGLN